jgi:hypothetical protein
VTRRSVGSGTRAGRWDVAGADGAASTVVFICDERPGIWLALTLAPDGTETVTGFEIRDQHPERPAEVAIGARLLRSVPLGRLAHQALRKLQDGADRAADPQFWRDDPAGWEGAMENSLSLRSVTLGHKRPGPRGYPLEYYAKLAVEYEAWLKTGERLSVLAKRKCMSESALRAALGTARRKGLLTPTPRGRAGGHATDHAKALLLNAVGRRSGSRATDPGSEC